MEITGTIKVKNNEVQVSEKFKKREFVITDNSSQYPQHIQFQLTQDRCGLIENYKVGDEIKVFFNLRGREWKNPQGEVKYFNSLEAWRIESVSSNNNQVSSAPSDAKAIPALDAQSDDLPF